MAEIEKAPLLDDMERNVALTSLQYHAQAGEDIRWNKVSEVIAKTQRDADYKYYLREFIIWLRTQGAEVSGVGLTSPSLMESEALFSLRNGIFISLDKLGLLQKEAEG